jgi:hypothetical protein
MFQLPAGPEFTARRGVIVRAEREPGAPGRPEPTVPLDFETQRTHRSQLGERRNSLFLRFYAFYCGYSYGIKAGRAGSGWRTGLVCQRIKLNQTKSNHYLF